MRASRDRKSNYTKCGKLGDKPLDDPYVEIRPTCSQWRCHFNDPSTCDDGESWLRGHLPKYDNAVAPGYRGCNIVVLYFEHSINIGLIVTFVGFIPTLFAGVWMYRKTDNTLEGFGVAAYIVDYTGMLLVMYFAARNLG